MSTLKGSSGETSVLTRSGAPAPIPRVSSWLLTSQQQCWAADVLQRAQAEAGCGPVHVQALARAAGILPAEAASLMLVPQAHGAGHGLQRVHAWAAGQGPQHLASGIWPGSHFCRSATSLRCPHLQRAGEVAGERGTGQPLGEVRVTQGPVQRCGLEAS